MALRLDGKVSGRDHRHTLYKTNKSPQGRPEDHGLLPRKDSEATMV